MTPEAEKALREAVRLDKEMPMQGAVAANRAARKLVRDHADELLSLVGGWVPVSERLPEAGQQVAVRRKNGSWDRGEIAPMYFDGLPGWYLPEGPTMLEDAPHWSSVPDNE